jgi:beta-lactam-binding protein with PASTA domain
MKDFIDFLKNRSVQKKIILAFAGLFLCIEFVFLSIRVYTRHGQALSVPDFSGMNLEEVSSLIDLKRLRYEIIDSVFIQGQKPGTIVAQNPSANTKVKENRTIFLTINAINPEKVKMPNVVGVSIRQAEARLITSGLRVGDRRYVPDIGRDYVLRQLYKGRDIPEGKMVIRGSAISLVLGLGASDQITYVPDLKTLTLPKAQQVASDSYLNIGAIIPDNSIETASDSLKAVIWKQRPEPGSSINVGHEIDVWLTIDQGKAGIYNDSIPR